jgi:hypothetical protein
MILLILFGACAAAAATAQKRTVISVTTDYERPQEGWITLNLDHAAMVTRIEWCKTIMPTPANFEGIMPPDINACNARGLMHLQLYPGIRPLVRTQVDEPNTYYIDPINVGGWDEDHQANVIVHATIDDATDLVHVFRFNPISELPAPTTTTASTIATTTIATTTTKKTTTRRPSTIKTTLTTTTQTPDPAPVLVAIVTTETITTEQQKQTTEPAISAANKYSISGMAAIFGIGAFLVLTLGLFNYARMSNWSVDRLRRRVGMRGYFNFSTGTSDQEMEFLSGGASEDDNVVEMDDMQKMDILKQLGSGASPAFSQNQEK